MRHRAISVCASLFKYLLKNALGLLISQSSRSTKSSPGTHAGLPEKFVAPDSIRSSLQLAASTNG